MKKLKTKIGTLLRVLKIIVKALAFLIVAKDILEFAIKEIEKLFPDAEKESNEITQDVPHEEVVHVE
jgi:large-conductance mechanosensitive channel